MDDVGPPFGTRYSVRARVSFPHLGARPSPLLSAGRRYLYRRRGKSRIRGRSF